MKNESKLTWKDVVKEALAEIGNSGHLDDINSQIEGHWKTKTNPTWKDTVRRTLQQYSIFYQEEGERDMVSQGGEAACGI